MQIKEEDEWKAAFTTHLGVYEPVVVYFGLTNLPATFQVMMNDILQDLIDKGDIAAFIDDVIVGMETEEGHDEIVEEMLKWMEDHDLYLKPEKCVWKVKKVGFLGLIIGKDGIKMEEEKVKGVLDWSRPKCVKDIQKFLRLANYYRRFVKGFATIAKLLHWLVKKDEKWNWGEKQKNLFQGLKKVFTTKPILVVPDLDKEMRVEANASEYATEGVLSMRCEDDKWRPIGFISKSFNEAERNYKIHDWEMLEIIRSLEEWRHLLEGAQNKFEIWSDHKNLEYFMGSQKLNRRQARWALYLSRFNFILKHVPGNSMGRADSLSQRPDWQVGVEKDNEDRVLIKKEWMEVRAMQVEKVIIEGVDLLEKVKKSEAKDDEVVKAVEEMKYAGVKVLRDEEWQEEDGVMLRDGKVYILKDEKLRAEVIWLHYDMLVGGHGGQ